MYYSLNYRIKAVVVQLDIKTEEIHVTFLFPDLKLKLLLLSPSNDKDHVLVIQAYYEKIDLL